MALEQVFECPSTLAKLRIAPLGELLDCFCKWLLDHDFSRGTTRLHLGHLCHLNEHLRRPRGRMRQTVAAGEVEGFFDNYASRCRNRGPLEGHLRRVRHSVNRFTDYLREEGRFLATAAREIYEPLLAGYLQWMRSYQHAAPGTLGLRAHSLIRFLQSLGQDASPRGLAKLDCEKVEQFVLAYASANGRSARRSMQSALRTFFRFALHAGYLRQPLDRAVPTLRTYKLATVPRGLTEQQTQEVLRGVERNTGVGRRDCAILQLLSTYGVRGGQLRTLPFGRTRLGAGPDPFQGRQARQGRLGAHDPGGGRSRLGLFAKWPSGLLLPGSLSDVSGSLSSLPSFEHALSDRPTPPLRGGHRSSQRRRTRLSARFRHPHASAGQWAEGDRGCARSSTSD